MTHCQCGHPLVEHSDLGGEGCLHGWVAPLKDAYVCTCLVFRPRLPDWRTWRALVA